MRLIGYLEPDCIDIDAAHVEASTKMSLGETDFSKSANKHEMELYHVLPRSFKFLVAILFERPSIPCKNLLNNRIWF